MINKIYNFIFFKTIFEKFYNGRDIIIVLDINKDYGWYIKFFIRKNEKLILNQLTDDFYFKSYQNNSIDLASSRIFLNYFDNDKIKLNELVQEKFIDLFLEKKHKLKLFRI